MFWPWAGLATGSYGHVLGLSSAVLAIRWSHHGSQYGWVGMSNDWAVAALALRDHCLGRPWLVWLWAWLSTGWAGHGLG